MGQVTQTYATDLTDELISLELADGSTVGYTHDAQGNRTSRTVDGLLDASWAWDDLSSLPMRIGEYDATGALSTAWLADPTSSTGASLAQTSSGVSSWLLSDPFANTVATVSTTGNTVSGTRTMDAFGVDRIGATGSLADASVGFAGQYLDTATGLYDMRARDYDPATGRFTATDPVAVPTGMPYVAGYSYSYNNPLMYSDVNGLLPIHDPRHGDTPGPLYAEVGSTWSGGSYSWTGYQETETVQYALVTSSVDCERDVAVGFSEVNDYCVGELKKAAEQDLRQRGGCWTAFAWYSEHSDAITATAGVVAWGQVSYVGGKFSAPQLSTRPAATNSVGVAAALRARLAQQAGFSGTGPKIIVDENLPSSWAQEMRVAGYDARSIAEMKIQGASDAQITQLADQVGARVLTRDVGHQVDGGFGSRSITVDSRVRTVDSVLRLIGGS